MNDCKYRYPGAEPFVESQKDIFFGRKSDVERIIQDIRLESMVVVHSKSGLGKSSLINAGVIPQLRETGRYNIVTIRFGARRVMEDPSPLELISQQIATLHQDRMILDKIYTRENSLWYHCKGYQQGKERRPLLLIFDQFEELFTYPADEIDELKKELSECLSQGVPQRFIVKLRSVQHENPSLITEAELDEIFSDLKLNILIAIRSDRIHLLDRLSDYLPSIKNSRHELKALEPEKAREAILGPAKSSGAFCSPIFEYLPEAVNSMIEYATDDRSGLVEGIQLQILCQYIEEKVIKEGLQTITVDDLRDVEQIFGNFYEHRIQLVENENDQEIARRFIEDGLVIAENEQRVPMHQAHIHDRYQISEALLQQLIDTRILRREYLQDEAYLYELSHDALVPHVLRSRRERKEKERKAAELRQAEIAQQEIEFKLTQEKLMVEQQSRRRMQIMSMFLSFMVLITVGLGIRFYDSSIANGDLARDIDKKADSLQENNLRLEEALSELRDLRIKEFIREAAVYEGALRYDLALKKIEEGLVMKSDDAELLRLKEFYHNKLRQ